MTQRTPDLLVVGGGVVGLCLALEARRRFPDAQVAVLEKEQSCGLHASGRNSGVLHAGFYYTADSLKARFTWEGNREWTGYAEERGLAIRRCGKLVLARDPSDWPGLDELARRASVNGVELREVTADEAREIEPRARTCERALFSPTTSTIDPAEAMRSLADDARRAGVGIHLRTAYLGRRGGRVETSRGSFSPGYVINAAGLYADQVARDFGFSQDYRILPFKGLYLYSSRPGWLRTHLYPVPELNHPFLGVHFTVTADGRVKIGPTATPAFWREHYGGWSGFRPRELLEIVARESALFLTNSFDFRTLAFRELRKYVRTVLLRQAARLADQVGGREEWRWGRAGIRAQLLNTRTRRLEMDFRFEGDDRSLHVLNAVSPAFTCAIPFSRYLVDEVEKHWGHDVKRPALATRGAR